MVAPVVRIRNGDSDQLLSVPLRRADKDPPGVLRIAGLDADAAVIAPEQLIVIGQCPSGAGDRFGRDHLTEQRIPQRRLCQPCKIECRRIILPAVKPVRICKMRSGQPQLLRAAVHLPHERLLAAA